jgi:hypothetical protein
MHLKFKVMQCYNLLLKHNKNEVYCERWRNSISFSVDTWIRNGISSDRNLNPGRDRRFSLFPTALRPALDTNQTPYSVGRVGYSTKLKLLDVKLATNCISVEATNTRSWLPLPWALILWCLIQQSDKSTCTSPVTKWMAYGEGAILCTNWFFINWI